MGVDWTGLRSGRDAGQLDVERVLFVGVPQSDGDVFAEALVVSGFPGPFLVFFWNVILVDDPIRQGRSRVQGEARGQGTKPSYRVRYDFAVAGQGETGEGAFVAPLINSRLGFVFVDDFVTRRASVVVAGRVNDQHVYNEDVAALCLDGHGFALVDCVFPQRV